MNPGLRLGWTRDCRTKPLRARALSVAWEDNGMPLSMGTSEVHRLILFLFQLRRSECPFL